MSRNGLIVVVVVALAVIVSVYFTYGRSSSNTGSPTATAPVSSTAQSADLVSRGATYFTQFRCNICHTTDGKRAAGPTLAGLYGSQVTLDNGQTVTADEEYLAESITNPDAQIVAGYGPSVMSAALADFTTQLNQDDTVAALVAYIKSVK
ncbi:MAG TPA: cytochrome c [Nitrolancea sp.]|nr:cytochrome c [Nitrolancea sp.]